MEAKFLVGAQTSLALGRFIGVEIMKFSRPRWVFFVYLTMCVI
jgi:FHS family L-fucose permease-like MFS transporter